MEPAGFWELPGGAPLGSGSWGMSARRGGGRVGIPWRGLPPPISDGPGRLPTPPTTDPRDIRPIPLPNFPSRAARHRTPFSPCLSFWF